MVGVQVLGAVVLAFSLCACGEPEPAALELVARTLVDHRQWMNVESVDDPLPAHQPPTIACGVAGWFVEYDALEIDTTRCNYASLQHPSLLVAPAGTEVTTQLIHYDLEAPEPAEAHVAILFGDVVQWEAMVAIPQAANVIDLSFHSTVALEVGDPIRVHLHNHGQNFWALGPIMAAVPTAP